jgi:hypothetical protein
MGILAIACSVFLFTFFFGAGVLTVALFVIRPIIWILRGLRRLAR